jgi:hypothetical protein
VRRGILIARGFHLKYTTSPHLKAKTTQCLLKGDMNLKRASGNTACITVVVTETLFSFQACVQATIERGESTRIDTEMEMRSSIEKEREDKCLYRRLSLSYTVASRRCTLSMKFFEYKI